MRLYFSSSRHALKVSNAYNGLVRNVILRIALHELAARVQQKQLALPLPDLFLVDHDNDARRGCVIEEVFRQVKANKLFIVLHQLERPGARADFLVDAVQLIIIDVAETFREEEECKFFSKIKKQLNETGLVP